MPRDRLGWERRLSHQRRKQKRWEPGIETLYYRALFKSVGESRIHEVPVNREGQISGWIEDRGKTSRKSNEGQASKKEEGVVFERTLSQGGAGLSVVGDCQRFKKPNRETSNEFSMDRGPSFLGPELEKM